jgi:hypothetical protein
MNAVMDGSARGVLRIIWESWRAAGQVWYGRDCHLAQGVLKNTARAMAYHLQETAHLEGGCEDASCDCYARAESQKQAR